jgi:hypothetical protein
MALEMPDATPVRHVVGYNRVHSNLRMPLGRIPSAALQAEKQNDLQEL